MADEPEDIIDDDTEDQAPEDDAASEDEDATGEDEDADDDADDESETDKDEDDDSEEVEFEGATYKLPPALKNALLRQSDYTRKTQEVAARAKELEQRDETLKEQAKLADEDLTDRATLQAINQEIKGYENVDWAKLNEDDPVGYNAHQLRLTQLKQARGETTEKIKGTAGKRAADAKRDFETRVAKTQTQLAKDIKGWGQELAQKLTVFAESQGFTAAEMRAMNTQPAMVKALHKAMLYDAAQKKQRKAKDPPPQPLKTVDKGRSRAAGSAIPSDKDSVEAWMAKRAKQAAARAKRGY